MKLFLTFFLAFKPPRPSYCPPVKRNDLNSYNAYIVGFGTNFNSVKLNPVGSNLWLKTYVDIGPTVSQTVLVDNSTNVYVAGSDTDFYYSGGYQTRLTIIKYDSNGNQLWNTNYFAGTIPTVQVEGAALDSAGNLYLVFDCYPIGEGLRFTSLKYSSSGSLLWTAFNPTGGGHSQAYGLALDNSGDVFPTGQQGFYYPNLCYATYELNSNGACVWTNQYPQPIVGASVATSIATDQSNNIYVTGYSPGTNSSNDIVTIKYRPNGNQVWLKRYNGPGNGNAAGNAIAVDNSGNVYVTGYETTAVGGTEIVTIKYSPLTLQRRANGTVLLQAQGAPGASFDFQASADLQRWLDLGSVTADSNGLVQFDDTNASNYHARFYVTSPQ